jgi:hypothetical protein
MGEDFLGGLNVRLVARHPRLDKVVVDASGDKSPCAPFSISFAQLLPRDVVFAGNVFPFTTLRDLSAQTDELIGYCETLLRPIYVDLLNYESLADWQKKPDWQDQLSWLVITAAYAVTYKEPKAARNQIQAQLAFLETYEPIRKRSSFDDLNKMADKAIAKSFVWAKEDLLALASTLNP